MLIVGEELGGDVVL